METNTPMISGDDYNAILEDKSLQEYADEVNQDSVELIEESKDVIDSTVEVIASTEEIEAAENAGLLSAITVKAYSNRVNSYLDKLESKYIITKDDKLKPGLQFDNPRAGLLSIKETLKSAIRKVIEWLAKAFNWYIGWLDVLVNKITQFVTSRAGISKSLRKKIEDIKDSDYLFIDTNVYEEIVRKRALEFEYAIKGKAKKLNFNPGGQAYLSSMILTEKLDAVKILSAFEDILEDKTKSKIPSLTEDGTDVIIRDLGNQNKIEQLVVNDNFVSIGEMIFGRRSDFERDENRDGLMYKHATFSGGMKTLDATGAKARNTRAIINVDTIDVIVYSDKGLSLVAHTKLGYKTEEDFATAIKISVDPKSKPSVMIEELNYLVKIVDQASDSLKSMAKESKERAKAVKSWSDRNIQELKKIAIEDAGKTDEWNMSPEEIKKRDQKVKNINDDSKIFNSELKNKLNADYYMINKFPQIVTSMIKALSSTVDDGVRLIEASLVQSPAKAERSKTGNNEDGRYLLLAVPERYNEIIDVEVID